MAGYVEVDLDDVMMGLDAMVRAGRDLRPVFKDARQDLRKDLQDHFAHAEGPSGSWAPRASSSVAAILSHGGQRRNVTRRGTVKRRAAKRLANQLGKLRSAWRIRYDRGSLEAASIVKWSAIHQEGGIAGHGAHIPARPFAWASQQLLGAIANRISDHIVRGWER